MWFPFVRTFAAGMVAWQFCLVAAVSWSAEADDEIPARLKGVGIDEKLDTEIPLDLKFTDSSGAAVTFRSLLQNEKPILLTLNYSNCPGLCIAQLNGLIQGINQVSSLQLGKDFQMVSLSIDPRESIKKSASTKARYADDLEKKHSPEGWFFLTGSEQNIIEMADAVGFRYTYDAKHNQFNHSAAAIFLSPQGRITRYLYEIGFTPETLKMAFIEAGEGRIGSRLDAFVLWCSHYDANENRYTASAKILLSVCAGGFVTLVLLSLLPFWLSSWKARRLKRETETIRHAAPA
ncbi:MAG: SCO family protein [Planctomycetes bacterium]|nr:SCO family protein [Planctomycetota bacterium]